MRRIGSVFWLLVFMILGIACRGFAFDDTWDTVEIHGFISQGFLKSEGNNVIADSEEGTFQFNEFGMNFSTDLTDRLRAGLQFVSRDLGDLGNNTVNIDWAYADYRWKDWLGLRGGIIKLPWGLYNETRDLDMLRTSIFLPSSVYAEEERDSYSAIQGIDIYGNFSIWFLGNISYQLQYGDKSMDLDGGLVRRIEMEAGAPFEYFDVTNFALSWLEWETPVNGLRLRQTSARYEYAFGGTTCFAYEDGELGILEFMEKGRQVFAMFSVDYMRERLTLATEWFSVWENSDDVDTDGDNDEDAQQEGGYVGASYRFGERLELGAYYSVYYEDGDDREGKDFEEVGLPKYLAWQKDAALTVRFDLNEHWTIKAEGHWINGAARLFLFNPLDTIEEESFLLAVKTTFNF